MRLNLLRMEIRYEHDVVLVRQRARQIAAALKFDSQDQTRIATALSELARNAFQYAGGGFVEFRIEKSPVPALLISVIDKGPGIANVREIRLFPVNPRSMRPFDSKTRASLGRPGRSSRAAVENRGAPKALLADAPHRFPLRGIRNPRHTDCFGGADRVSWSAVRKEDAWRLKGTGSAARKRSARFC